MKAFATLIASSYALKLTLPERECADNRPEAGDNTVTIFYYQNYDGGQTGDDCNSCSEDNYLNQNTFYASPEMYDFCTTWPGHSGENSVTNGKCGADSSFSIDQRTTCDCSGNITNKEAFVNKCVVDKPTNMCAQIADYSGCE